MGKSEHRKIHSNFKECVLNRVVLCCGILLILDSGNSHVSSLVDLKIKG